MSIDKNKLFIGLVQKRMDDAFKIYYKDVDSSSNALFSSLYRKSVKTINKTLKDE